MCRAAMVDAAAHRRCARQSSSERGSDDRPALAGKTRQPAAEACVSSRQQDDLDRHRTTQKRWSSVARLYTTASAQPFMVLG